MITSEEKEQLKEVLGNHYTSSILEILDTEGALSLSRKPFTANMIRAVFNGHRAHKVIEAAIYKAYQKAKKHKDEQKEKRKSILKSA